MDEVNLRAVRRHHRERLKKKRSHYHSGSPDSRIVDTPTPCSCFICGNPRKWWKEKTIQERRLEQE